MKSDVRQNVKFLLSASSDIVKRVKELCTSISSFTEDSQSKMNTLITQVHDESKQTRELIQNECEQTRDMVSEESNDTRELFQDEIENTRELMQDEGEKTREAVLEESENVSANIQGLKRKVESESCIIKNKIACKRDKFLVETGRIARGKKHIKQHTQYMSHSVDQTKETVEVVYRKADCIEETVENMYEDLIDFMREQRSENERTSTKLSDVREMSLQTQLYLQQVLKSEFKYFY